MFPGNRAKSEAVKYRQQCRIFYCTGHWIILRTQHTTASLASVSHIDCLQAETTWEWSLERKNKGYLLAAILLVGLDYLDLWQPMALREPERMSETVGIKSRFEKSDEIQLSKLECKFFVRYFRKSLYPHLASLWRIYS